MVTKRGTNQFHGSAYEYYFAQNVASGNTWDNNHTPLGNLGYTPLADHPQQPLRRAHWADQLIPVKVLGGKSYFFVNYEGFRFPQIGHLRTSRCPPRCCARA